MEKEIFLLTDLDDLINIHLELKVVVEGGDAIWLTTFWQVSPPNEPYRWSLNTPR
jgi:hypothetical protein